MVTILLLAATYAAARLVAGAITSLRYLPRSNDDMIFF